MIQMNNTFFKYDDKKTDKLIFQLDPQFFWSRLYEYPFCLDFVKKNDVILDCCCGVYHPFKFALINKCKEVDAIDLEDLSKENILKEIEIRFGKEELKGFDESLINKINFKKDSITNLSYKDKKFDKIFCISSLEHMDKEVVCNGLKELKRVLKDNGRIILTIDYPTLLPQDLIKIIKEVELKIDGNYDFDLKGSEISTTYFGSELKVYNLILKK